MAYKRLKIGDLEVEEHLIQYVGFQMAPPPVFFSIVATEEHGKKLENRLKQLEKEKALAFYAADGGHQLSGLCNIRNLTVDVDESKAPVLYRINGGLEILH